jgi:hypothetical protein
VDDEVIVIVGLDESYSVDPSELSELRVRIARIARKAGIEPVSITVRNLDSTIVVTEAGWVTSASRQGSTGTDSSFPWEGQLCPECGAELDVIPIVTERHGIRVAYACSTHGLVSIADPLEPSDSD